MRFSVKIFVGLLLLIAGLGAAGFGAATLQGAFAERRAAAAQDRSPPRERVFTVVSGTIENTEISPEIIAYGEIRSWRTLELRASAGGYIVDLAEGFRDGVAVEEGDFLFRIDPEEFIAAEADARVAVLEAEADLREAIEGVEVAKRELAAADTQRDLRASALTRQQDLRRRGVATSSLVEEAEMSLASAEQTAASRAQMVLTSEIQIDRNRLRLERARIALSEAERVLAETIHRAPFAGLVSEVSLVPGGLVTANEKVGDLIDPTALEASFRVTNAQFARLLDESGALKNIDVTVSLDLDDRPLTVRGVIDRAGAVIEAGQTGRLIFAKLETDRATLLRPGDFVSVSIIEPPLRNVARIPSSAVTEEGELLLVEDERLKAIMVTILRRTGDDVVVSGAPEGAVFVAERTPQLGKGVKVKLIGDAAAPKAAAEDLVTLDPERREKMIAWVEANQRMPAEMKARILKRLRTGKAPQQMVERLSQRMGG